MSRTFFQPPRRRKQQKSVRLYALCFGAALLALALSCYRVLWNIFLDYVAGEYISALNLYVGAACALAGSAALLFGVGALREAYLAHRELQPKGAKVRRINTRRP